MAKEGSTISGLMDSFATSISYCLQYGVPLKFLVDKFGHVRFEPSGWTGNQQIPYAKSIPDYIFRWLACEVPGRRSMRRTKRASRRRCGRRRRVRRKSLPFRGGGDRCADVRGVRRDDDAERDVVISARTAAGRAAVVE